MIDVTPMSSVSVSGGVATVGRRRAARRCLRRAGRPRPDDPGRLRPDLGIAGLTLGGGLGDPRPHARPHLRPAGRRAGRPRRRARRRLRRAAPTRSLLGAARRRRRPVRRRDLACLRTRAGAARHDVPSASGRAHDAAAVIEAWQDWAPDAPDELAASLRLIAAGRPDRGARRQPVRRRARHEPGGGALRELFAARRRRARRSRPAPAVLRRAPSATSPPLGPGDGARPAHGFGKSEFFRTRAAGRNASRRSSGMLAAGREAGEHRSSTSHPGAARTTRRPRRDRVRAPRRALPARARGRRGAENPAPGAIGCSARGRSCTRWGSGGVYPNFPDTSSPTGAAYHGANHDRLAASSAAYDPDNLFRFEQALA